MFKWLGGLIDSNDKEIKKMSKTVEQVNKLEPEFKALSDEALRNKTAEFKERVNQATEDLRKKLADKRAELAEAKACLAEAVAPFEKDAQNKVCKGLEEDAAASDKELAKAENKILNDILPEAFAAVREAARRTVGQRHYDVQLIGGIVLHQGKIAEMRTGEGKTIVATLPLYLNCLTGRGVHLITVNDYLARRDPYWYGPVYHALGVKVASIYPMQTPDEMQPSRLFDPGFDSGDKTWPHYRKITRKEAYQADITYGQSSEFGFDYLRDNMVIDLNQAVQRPLNFAVVDEVDNLLIDEARTPLIISGQREESLKEYEILARIAPQLKKDADYKMSEKGRGVDEITEEGFENAERLLRREGLITTGSIVDEQNASLLHHLRNAVTAKEAYQRDKEYVVKGDEIIIVDEFTGRLMLGRRYEGGLHQAIEAKEHVKVQKETMTYATITIQNYFRMYNKLSGMTGTAVTEAEEFSKIYNLEVVQIPTNKPMVREDASDKVYKTESGKFKAVVEEISESHAKGQPVLLGTVSIEKSERVSGLLKRRGIAHEVLNAKQHEREANIIAQAGRPGAVTVATNMAGRGVDIILGGTEPVKDNFANEDEFKKAHDEWKVAHDKVIEMGGLHVVGTERHEARRIDNQLRGRAGRQGDPGSTRFYVSLEDDLMRRFGGDRIKSVMEWAGMDEDTAIENSIVSKSIEGAQVKVEGYHFDLRKHLVDYDDVINTQRKIIYEERRKILAGADLKANILTMVKNELQDIVEKRAGGDNELEPDHKGIISDVIIIMPLPEGFAPENLAKMTPGEISEVLQKHAVELYDRREKDFTPEAMRILERLVMLRTMDNLWIEHLTAMEGMREGIGLEAVAQHDPLVTYKTRGHEMFQELMGGIQGDLARTIFHMAIRREPAPGTPASPAPTASATANARPIAATSGTATAGSPTAARPAPARPVTPTSPLAHVPQSPMANVVARNPNSGASAKQPMKVAGKKVGRNDPCPCGSGKKYKHCCGK